ncbi:MAG TPA: hypothetical protein VEW03_11525 [Longimicrobiaceae bacterium]|nr:hypothetical protein [Longimicrobiaceae bacterium]
MRPFPRLPVALAAVLLLAGCGSSDESAAVPADTTVAPGVIDVPGRADDVARARVDSANAAMEERVRAVDALSKEAGGSGN